MRTSVRRLLQTREITILGVIIVLCVVLSLTTKNFLAISNISNTLLGFSGIAIISIGMTMVIVTGGIDVSVGSILGIASVVAGKLLLMHASAPVILAGALITGLAVGLLNGVIVAYGNIPPIIVTLGTMNVIRALLFGVLGGRWVSGVPKTITPIGLGKFLALPIPIWITIVLIVIFTFMMGTRPLGRAVYAMGNNLDAARISGVNINGVNLFVYSLTGVLAGLAGLIYVARTGIVQTNTGMGLELEVIAAVVLGGTSIMGGKGTLIGSFLGAALLGIVQNGMVLLNIPALTEGLVTGLLIIVSVLIDIMRARGYRDSTARTIGSLGGGSQ
jgi:ribose/xylose/arabinose/galactoside ABC-type transport system permease subunit